ncbi:hypothetical protein BKA83DRAFT_4127320 [Pisolithus microcarpus]|nr:hypothetical protein BKA83DRAFT_4127320 [Pisolithus microcarpus]
MHTTQQHKEALAIYEIKKSASEKKLKSLGLHPIKNVFWSVEHSEPEQAASFELLHSLHGGMGGKHMHEELKIVVSKLGHDTETKLEEQVTETTIGMIEKELTAFRDKLKAYCSCICHLDDTGLKEDWNFPKAHLWKHVAHDIQSKGVVCNYSAWPNEKMHGLLKDAYQDCSNGKNIAGQVHIDAENEHTNLVTDDNGGSNDDDDETFEGNTKLSAPQQPTSLSDVETSHKDDRAFDRFHWKLETFINTCLPTYGYPLDEWI